MIDNVVKLSGDYVNFTAQFINPQDMRLEEELTDSNDLNFTLPEDEPQRNTLSLMRKVSLHCIDGVTDGLLWTGYISRIEFNGQTRQFEIACTDEKGFMKNKILYANKDFNADISSVLTTLVDEANTREGSSFLSFETNLVANVDKEFNQGNTYFNILNEIAELLDAEWTVDRGKIIFRDTIGIDRTTGEDFFEVIQNKDSPNETNASIQSSVSGDEFVNAVLGKDDSSSSDQSDAASIADVGRIERLVRFNNGSLPAQTTEFLDKSKNPQAEIESRIVNPEIDFRDVNIGDLVKIRVNLGNDFSDIVDSVKVIAKSTQFSRTTGTVNIKVSKLRKQLDTPQNKLANIDRALNELQLKV